MTRVESGDHFPQRENPVRQIPRGGSGLIPTLSMPPKADGMDMSLEAVSIGLGSNRSSAVRAEAR